MRKTFLLATLVVTASAIAACGGDSSSSNPTGPGTPTQPNPAVATPVATTVTAQAGDNQSANAGSAVAVAPTVLVRDQDAKPMAGVVVAFVVDSGGGSVGTASVTTGSDGVASSGKWSLGAGRNKLRATAGPLSPVFFVANATGELAVGGGTVGAAGGVVTVSRPGTPVDGMQLKFPLGSTTSNMQVTVAYGDSTGAPKRSGLRLASPVITVGTDVAFSDVAGPVTLTIPANIAANESPVAIAFNRANGAMMTLPTVVSGVGKVTTITRLLDASLLDAPGAVPESFMRASLRASRANQNAAIQIVIGAISYNDLQKDFDTGYVPGVDDWEFDNVLTSYNPKTATASLTGLAITSAWYFDHFKASRGALNKRYQKAADVEWSNARGVRIGAMAGTLVDGAAFQAYASALVSMAALATPAVTPDSLTMLVVKAGLFTTNRPMVLAAVDQTLSAPHGTSVLVYSTRGNGLNVSLGTSAKGINEPRTVTLANGAFAPQLFGDKSPDNDTFTTFTLSTIVSTGLTSGIPASALNQLWQDFFANTVGQSVFPVAELVSRESRAIVDTIFVPDDTTRFWLECTNCDYSYAVTSTITPKNNVAAGRLYRKLSNVWQPFAGTVYGAGFKLTDSNDGQTVGLALYTAPVASAVPQTRGRYFDWTQFVVKTKRLTIAPNPLTVAGGYDFNMTATYNRPTPAGARWIWELGDGRSVTTTTNTITAQYPTTQTKKTFDVKVSMRIGTVLEATGHITAEVTPAEFAWQLTSVSVTGSTLPVGGIGSDASDTTILKTVTTVLNSLKNNPSGNQIWVFGLANGGAGCEAGVVWYQYAPGQLADSLSSGPGIGYVPVGLLGSCGLVEYSGNLTLGQLGSGTLIGNAVEIPDPQAIVLPGGSINATMSGKTLSGTFVWLVRYSTGMGTYTISFQATQTKP